MLLHNNRLYLNDPVTTGDYGTFKNIIAASGSLTNATTYIDSVNKTLVVNGFTFPLANTKVKTEEKNGIMYVTQAGKLVVAIDKELYTPEAITLKVAQKLAADKPTNITILYGTQLWETTNTQESTRTFEYIPGATINVTAAASGFPAFGTTSYAPTEIGKLYTIVAIPLESFTGGIESQCVSYTYDLEGAPKQSATSYPLNVVVNFADVPLAQLPLLQLDVLNGTNISGFNPLETSINYSQGYFMRGAGSYTHFAGNPMGEVFTASTTGTFGISNQIFSTGIGFSIVKDSEYIAQVEYDIGTVEVVYTSMTSTTASGSFTYNPACTGTLIGPLTKNCKASIEIDKRQFFRTVNILIS